MGASYIALRSFASALYEYKTAMGKLQSENGFSYLTANYLHHVVGEFATAELLSKECDKAIADYTWALSDVGTDKHFAAVLYLGLAHAQKCSNSQDTVHASSASIEKALQNDPRVGEQDLYWPLVPLPPVESVRPLR